MTAVHRIRRIGTVIAAAAAAITCSISGILVCSRRTVQPTTTIVGEFLIFSHSAANCSSLIDGNLTRLAVAAATANLSLEPASTTMNRQGRKRP